MGSGQSSQSKQSEKTDYNKGHPPQHQYPSSAPPPQQHQYGAPPPGYNDRAGAVPPDQYQPPPPYSSTPHNSLVTGTSQPQVQQYNQQYMSQYHGQYPATNTGPVHAQFDAGARFSAVAPPSIPPPPPGVAPNPAQLAAMKGQHVVMSQKEGGFFNGSGE